MHKLDYSIVQTVIQWALFKETLQKWSNLFVVFGHWKSCDPHFVFPLVMYTRAKKHHQPSVERIHSWRAIDGQSTSNSVRKVL